MLSLIYVHVCPCACVCVYVQVGVGLETKLQEWFHLPQDMASPR